mgnify:CR=1 FL=1
MNDLSDIRWKINLCDEKLISLIKERFSYSKEVALYKKENNLPIFDAKREEELIKKNLEILNDKDLETYYLNIFKSILNESKEYQKKVIENE